MNRQAAIDVLGAARERKLFQEHGHDVYAYVHHVTATIWGDGGSGSECKRCGAKTVAVEMKQTRSADEGMTAIFTCSTCGANWRV